MLLSFQSSNCSCSFADNHNEQLKKKKNKKVFIIFLYFQSERPHSRLDTFCPDRVNYFFECWSLSDSIHVANQTQCLNPISALYIGDIYHMTKELAFTMSSVMLWEIKITVNYLRCGKCNTAAFRHTSTILFNSAAVLSLQAWCLNRLLVFKPK